MNKFAFLLTITTISVLSLGRFFMFFSENTTIGKDKSGLEKLIEEATTFDWDSIKVWPEKTTSKSKEDESETTVNNDETSREVTSIYNQETPTQLEGTTEETTIQSETSTKETIKPEELKLPAKFDYRKVGRCPKIKNQKQSQTCWAHASTSALESSILPAEKKIFSAKDMANYVKEIANPSEGGDNNYAMAYYLSWKGPVLKADENKSKPKVRKHVQSVQLVKRKNRKGIKELLYKYGGVTASIYVGDIDMQTKSKEYNPKKKAYYCSQNKDINHMILIIGWNDDFSRKNFRDKPKKDGAFICVNSWGKSVGEKGVFYLSYYDKSLGKEFACYTQVENADNYDNLYESDKAGNLGYTRYKKVNTAYFSSVYRAKNNEKLKAIGFYTNNKNIKYEVYVNEKYVGKKSLFKKAKKDVSGNFKNTGYYTVKLNNAYSLKKGQEFCVTVKIKGKTGNTRIPIEQKHKSMKVDLSDGKGFLSADGEYWESAKKEKCNICLKAYTTD